MRLIALISGVLFIVLVFLACNKEEVAIQEGTFKGTFSVKYSHGKQTASTTLELKDGRYSCAGNSNRIPAGGSGTYTIENNIIRFSEENFWTADFDWNLILGGDYLYSYDGKVLTLSAVNERTGQYTYRLVRQ